VGVEVGQITALSVMLVILLAWKKTASFNRFSKAANIALMLIGGLLLLMQLHSYQHTTYPDNFPLNQDDHHHVHAAMEKTSSQLSQAMQEPASIAAIAPPISEPQDKQQEQQQDKHPAKHSHDGAHFHSH
jgi:ABC-type nickel/cobalt efflux system permease component RcnA